MPQTTCRSGTEASAPAGATPEPLMPSGDSAMAADGVSDSPPLRTPGGDNPAKTKEQRSGSPAEPNLETDTKGFGTRTPKQKQPAAPEPATEGDSTKPTPTVEEMMQYITDLRKQVAKDENELDVYRARNRRHDESGRKGKKKSMSTHNAGTRSTTISARAIATREALAEASTNSSRLEFKSFTPRQDGSPGRSSRDSSTGSATRETKYMKDVKSLDSDETKSHKIDMTRGSIK